MHLTIIPQPKTNESLSSFMNRLAQSNGLDILHLLNLFKKTSIDYIQRSYIPLLDISPFSIIDEDKVIGITTLEINDIVALSFYKVLMTFCKNEDIERSRFISGVFTDEYKFCSDCLKEDNYFRLYWRIAELSICPQHNVQLVSRCQKCGTSIKLRDINNFDICPNCQTSLLDSKNKNSLQNEELAYQYWLINSWETLSNLQIPKIKPSESAMKILYVLNSQKVIFNREDLYDLNNLPVLLQFARGTLAVARTPHLNILFSTLFNNNVTMEQFLKLKVPNTFIKSILEDTPLKINQAECLAPWCPSYKKSTSLVKTGVSAKWKINGDYHLYYTICLDCGCEYAFDEHNNLIERTYFIQMYNYLQDKMCLPNLKTLAEETRLTVDKCRRGLAYFTSRNLFPRFCTEIINNELLNTVKIAVKSGQKVKEIRKWNCWTSYNHFLLYRYHQEIIRETIAIVRPIKMNSDNSEKRTIVRNALNELFHNDIDITIENVSAAVEVCPETLRNWGILPYISEMKSLQMERRRNERNQLIYKKVEEFIALNQEFKISPLEIYKFIGIRRTVLWRSSPELTAYITDRIKIHNQNNNKRETK